MKEGYLSQYFEGIAIKGLSTVEADLFCSHQHEFNGVNGLKQLFGSAKGKTSFSAKFVYLRDADAQPIAAEGFLTWYDAREKHPTRSEYRLYFPTTSVSLCASAGDLLVIGLRPDHSVLVIIAEGGSTISSQICWLFGIDTESTGFSVRGKLEREQDKIAFTSTIILEQIGITVDINEDTYLEEMLDKFNHKFPSTFEFSEYARSTLSHINPLDDADKALLAWAEREEVLFRTLEKHLIANRLSQGFEDDVDGFLSFSLSVQNRRKSRVGYALENHLEEIFSQYKINYSRTKITENKSKPDFIFPNIENYHDVAFDPSLLTMLGVKSTCKDRWRQVLSEADKIEHKHLLTLEAAISENQTNEMKDKNLQLIIPRILHETYSKGQQTWLMDLNTFLNLVQEKETRSKAVV